MRSSVYGLQNSSKMQFGATTVCTGQQMSPMQPKSWGRCVINPGTIVLFGTRPSGTLVSFQCSWLDDYLLSETADPLTALSPAPSEHLSIDDRISVIRYGVEACQFADFVRCPIIAWSTSKTKQWPFSGFAAPEILSLEAGDVPECLIGGTVCVPSLCTPGRSQGMPNHLVKTPEWAA